MRLPARITAVLILGVLLLMVIAQYVMLRRENDEMTRTCTGTRPAGRHISQHCGGIWELGGQYGRRARSRRSMNCVSTT